jgi:16S rRNA processing protein RimM
VGRRAQRASQRAAIQPDEVRLGSINGVFGLKGEVRLFLYNAKSELFKGNGMDIVLVSPEGKRIAKHLTSRSGAGKRVLGQLNGIATPEAARDLAEWEIVCAATKLPELSGGEYYHRDLIGLAVHTEDGTSVGRITEILSGEDVDCWVVRSDDGEFLFPAVRDVVLSVDLHSGVTIVNDLEGVGA